MQRIRLQLRRRADRSYDVIVGRSILNDLHTEIQRLGSFSSYALVTDDAVRPLVSKPLQATLRSHDIHARIFSFPPGESAKTPETVIQLCHQLIEQGFDRKSLLVAVGGGVVGDIAGLTAAVYLRGIPYIQVPTTLLAQVDSAIGGKTGVDLPSGKNLIGAFHQPLLVASDLNALTTLPVEARRAGFAEIIKAALIAEPELFTILESEGIGLLDTENELLETVISKACQVKCWVVSQDEHESGLRRILNFGHTLGHALETALNYSIPHGEAVAAGMGVAIRFSRQWAGLGTHESMRALNLIQSMGLPTDLPEKADSEALVAALQKDKKIQANVCHLVLLKKIGQAVIYPIPVDDLQRNLSRI